MGQARPFDVAIENDDLLAEQGVFGDKLRPGAAKIAKAAEHERGMHGLGCGRDLCAQDLASLTRLTKLVNIEASSLAAGMLPGDDCTGTSMNMVTPTRVPSPYRSQL